MRRSVLIIAVIMLLGVPLPVLAENFEDDTQPDASPRETFRYDNATKLQRKLVLDDVNSSVNITVNTAWPAPASSQAKPKRKTKTEASPRQESAGLMTKHSDSGDYDLTLNGCTKNDEVARCQFTITNNGKVRNFQMGGNHTAKDNFGNEYHGKMAKKSKSYREIESASSASGTAEFTVTPNADSLAMLKLGIHCGDTEYFTFTRVPLERR